MIGRRIAPRYPDPIGILNAQYQAQPRSSVYQPSITSTTPMPPENKPAMSPSSMLNAGRMIDSNLGLSGYAAQAMNPMGSTANIPLAAFESGLTPVGEYGGELAGFYTPGSLGLPAGESMAALSPAAEAAGIAPALEVASAAPAVEAGLGAAAAEGAAGAAAAEGGLLAGAGALGPLALGGVGIYALGSLLDWW